MWAMKMTAKEIFALSQSVNLNALLAYRLAVESGPVK